ncbi:hypothetical protein [Tardiphaga sp. 862_B3_N1_1]|uniref:hypothetical protein n=1 Tax=Tardiphaga sp. 862_B3_N1_1 TaxID=3240763 RepID=UPI003F8AC9BA
MNVEKLVAKTNAPADVQAAAVEALNEARKRAKGLTWAKWKVRLCEHKDIAKLLTWDSERLIDVDPSLIDKDIAPVINITCYGDHIGWNDATGKPEPGTWMDKDPASADYQDAVAKTKAKGYLGVHPRSDKFHAWWYLRNAGEGRAWRLGAPVDMPNRPAVYTGKDVILIHSGQAWQLFAFRKLIGNFGIKTRIGYEIDNVWRFDNNLQGHYPVPGWQLRAPLSCTVLPGKRDFPDV